MSQHLISRYLNDLADLRRVSGEVRESVVREAFKTLLKEWGRSKDLIFIPEYKLDTATKDRRFVDGALLHALRVPFGYWEAKDEEDDLDAEIQKKFRRGYPQDNFVFEDSCEAVLFQNRQEVIRCPVDDPDRLEKLLNLFFSHQRPEIAEFRKAVAQFRTDLPAVLAALRAMIENADAGNPEFRAAALVFLKHTQETINPSVNAADVREMLIQHILTEEIFSYVFDNADFHRRNNIARELYRLEDTFFTGNLKHQTLDALKPYYAAIRSAAALVSSHHEKQNFLKVVYENFYKVYNRKAADRLGVVYTPNEIVRFMIESTDWLCQRHFGRQLIDKNVEILDPAAGTGTFIVELIEHFRGQPAKLKYKYREDLHANEVAILPYYVANLNIEATYAAMTGEYEEYPNLCFVDTLDNIAGLRERGRAPDFFGALSDENVARIKRQNTRKISVIIGNPPYNANQLNENENNKNREYDAIDKRIKETYIAASTAQKTKLYDPYARFFRWAADRIHENGIIAFVTNNSFIDGRTFDGFRKCLADEFSEIRVIDLKGNARTSGERRRKEAGNIFDDQIRVGVAIWFCVLKNTSKGCKILYECVRDYAKSDEKLEFLNSTHIEQRNFREIRPDGINNWLDLVDNDFDTLMPIATKATKQSRKSSDERAIFKLFSLGVVTARDEWVYDGEEKDLKSKLNFLIHTYNADVKRLGPVTNKIGLGDRLDYSIKWTRAVKGDLQRGLHYSFNAGNVCASLYRPYASKIMYFDKRLNEMQYRLQSIFPDGRKAACILISGAPSSKPFQCLATYYVPSYDTLEKTEALPLYRVGSAGQIENITDWAAGQFRAHYEVGRPTKRPITKDAIFHYVYGVLHDPIYREKYGLNLKREFPRIPFYAEFWRWADWGERLMALHIGYETVEPWPLVRTDVPDERSRRAELSPKALLRADKGAGIILLDTETQLGGIPKQAWDYRLGNRSALEWVLDQHKEKTPRDPTIREKFNTYRFADYKEKVIDLLRRVTRVSLETMEIVSAMRSATNAR